MKSLFPELVARYDDAVGAVEQCLTRFAVTRHKGRREEADRTLAPLQARANRLRQGILEAYEIQAKPKEATFQAGWDAAIAWIVQKEGGPIPSSTVAKSDAWVDYRDAN